MTDLTEPQSRPTVTRAEARENQAKALAEDVKFYVGRPCLRSHDGRRYTNSGLCVACAIAQGSQWKTDNPDRNRDLKKIRYYANPEKPREATRKSNVKHHAARLAYGRAYYEANKERRTAEAAAWNLAHKDWVRAQAAARRTSNPEQHRAKSRNRYALRCAASGTHTAEEIIDLFHKQNGKCANCLKSIKKAHHADHIIPLKRGGGNSIRNIQLLCPPCNQHKHAKDPIAFARENGRLL